MGKRRTAAKCPYCETGKLFYTEEVICHECTRYLKLGRELEPLVNKTTDNRRFYKASRISLHPTKEDRERGFMRDVAHDYRNPRKDAEHWLAHILIDLLNAETLSQQVTGRGTDDLPVVSLRPVNMGYYDHEVSCSQELLFLTEKQAAALDELTQLIRRQAGEYYRDGYSDGSNLLSRLATGDLTIERLNEKLDMR